MQKKLVHSFVAFAALLVVGYALGSERYTVAVVQDGPAGRELLPLDVLEAEIEALVGRDYEIVFLRQPGGDWTFSGASRALSDALARDDVDVIVTLGLLGSAAAARAAQLPKPVVSTLVGDVTAQNFPLQDGASGKRNFVYISDSIGIRTELTRLHEVVGAQHVAVLADEAWLSAFPELAEALRSTGDDLGIRVESVALTDRAEELAGRLPASADAVYVTPLPRFDAAATARLGELLIERQLPSFSASGRDEVETGLLMTASADEDVQSLARRVAVVLQRIILGTPPATISVDFQRPERLAFNAATAERIGFAPTWAVLQEADLIDAGEVGGTSLTFLDALNTAVARNRDLAVSRYEPALAAQDVRLARSPLLPQLGVGLSATRLKEGQADVLDLAADSVDVGLVASQTLYSERAFADLSIARAMAESTDFTLKAEVLDTIDAASAAYFELQRANALRDVRRGNLALSRDNLRLAEVRLRVGYSGRGDVLRWRSRLAGERSDLFDARAAVEQAQSALAQAINLPLDEPIKADDAGLGQLLDFLSSEDVQRYMNDPLSWRKLQAFYRDEAVANAPELGALDAEIRALERDRRARKREFFLPEVELTGRYVRNLDRSGGSSQLLDDNVDDEIWMVGLRATLPITTGAARRAGLSRAEAELMQAKARRLALVEALETRVSISAQAAGGSFPSIALALDAQRNAVANLALVRDQYSEGAIGVTDLIDAQDAALDARLASAEARYRFLIDMTRLQRAAGDFSLFLNPTGRQDWLDRVQRFYGKANR